MQWTLSLCLILKVWKSKSIEIENKFVVASPWELRSDWKQVQSFFEEVGNIPKQDYGDGCTTLQITLKTIKLDTQNGPIFYYVNYVKT